MRRMALAELRANRTSETVGIYAIGFLDASVTLFGRANQGRGLVDLTFYPAAYCLRHGLELLAKQMSVYVAYELRDSRLLYRQGHRFEELWQRQTAYVEALADGAPERAEEMRQHLDVLNTAVGELHELDPSSMLFRYPEDVRVNATGERTRTDQHVPFDAVNLGDWHATAEAVLNAAQALMWEVGERIGALRVQRGDPPLPISDLVATVSRDEGLER
jgi:hypothetical protein